MQSSPADRFQLLALLWSAKESALKALRVGRGSTPEAWLLTTSPDSSFAMAIGARCACIIMAKSSTGGGGRRATLCGP